MRTLSVIYVENDPALRGLFSSILRSKPAIADLYDFPTGEEAIAFGKNFLANVALLDVSLGNHAIDGVAVGTQLRLTNPNIGIVLFTQHSPESLSALLDLEKREGWSFIQKRADSNIDQIVEVLQLSAQGKRVLVSNNDSKASASSMPVTLTSRQHLVLSMLATGIEPKIIAENLNISFDSVRKDLSNAYSILVPHPEPGTDLRVTSILRYQQLTNSPLNHA